MDMNITCYEAGVSNLTGMRKMYYNPVSSAGHSIVEGFNGFDKTIEIFTIALNDFIAKPVDLIKVDAEGAALEVLQGADRVMPLITSWIIEVHDRVSSSTIFKWKTENREQILSLLSESGYKIRPLGKRHVYAYR